MTVPFHNLEEDFNFPPRILEIADCLREKIESVGQE
jgi:hypothetical protein